MGNFNYILIAVAVAVGPAVRVFLGRRNSKRYSVSTEGAVRVRAPRFSLIAVIILAPVGIALNGVGIFCLWFSIQAWIYSQDTSLFSYEDTAWVFLLALMSLAGGIFLSSLSYLMIMSLKMSMSRLELITLRSADGSVRSLGYSFKKFHRTIMMWIPKEVC